MFITLKIYTYDISIINLFIDILFLNYLKKKKENIYLVNEKIKIRIIYIIFLIKMSSSNLKMKITVGKKILHANLENNSSVKKLIQKFPLTLKMDNIYGREMCYRFGFGALPAEEAQEKGYEIGDIVYWPPRGSFVILYKQNGEEFEIQPIGHISEDVSFFDGMPDTEIKFELI